MDSLGTDFDALLTRGAVWALAAATCWAFVVVVAVAVEARTHGRVSVVRRTGCPPAVRLWLLGLFVAASTGVTPAHASETRSGSDTGPGTERTTDTSVGMALDGLRLPDRAAGAPPRRPPDRGQVVVVAPGDSLWRIVGNRLPADCDDAAVATAVAAVYSANRHTIGPDPDLVLPGQRLVVDALADFPTRSTLSEEP